MSTIRIKYDDRSITTDSSNNELRIKISKETNNGLSLVNNRLIATKGADGDPGVNGNKVGDGIYGTAGTYPPNNTIICNTTVTSKTTVNSNDLSGRINLYSTVIEKLLEKNKE